MERKHRFLLGGVLLAATVGYLIYSAVSETSVYYLTIGEFTAKKDTLLNEGVRVAGRVRTGTVQWEPRTNDLKFAIADFEDIADGDGDPGLPVHYTGLVPDMFAEGRDVIVEGKYGADGVFRAHAVLTSYPSKYEAEDGYGGKGEAKVESAAPRS
jgi:cytochrome c-type biogenesis protein CcmE